ncbi:hypothetical protein L596_028445 [Steinernema carpocapsae]|uniref:Uncharacterized protein n=1 Tax=Steinernema carpocapsae TaxID=34508 RepID=A0A4U5LYG2_STECR|nr:hypothetical protein L596_028445 [Steinernema carpocapsae]
MRNEGGADVAQHAATTIDHDWLIIRYPVVTLSCRLKYYTCVTRWPNPIRSQVECYCVGAAGRHLLNCFDWREERISGKVNKHRFLRKDTVLACL